MKKIVTKVMPITGLIVKCPKTGKICSADFCVQYCGETHCEVVHKL